MLVDDPTQQRSTARRIRVAIDGNAMFTGQAGVARYIRGLIHGLGALRDDAPDWHVLAWTVENHGYRQPQRALKTAYRELLWMRLVAPTLLRGDTPDVLHSPAGWWITPPRGVRHVVTLLDTGVLRHPERYRRWQRRSLRRALARIHEADLVLALSRFSATEGVRLLGIDPLRMRTVYPGCDFHPSAPPPAELAPAVALSDDFFLFVGSLEPGKNLALLREAYLLATREQRPLPPLVIVGARWEGVGREGTPPPGWHYLGRQSDAVLVHLYRRARALLFPSRYEGFGLPVAEAMALGCPVICSPVASLPEVAGDAALYAEQTADDYLRRMRELLASATAREELIARGLEQAHRFSWRRCAEETSDAYADVVARR